MSRHEVFAAFSPEGSCGGARARAFRGTASFTAEARQMRAELQKLLGFFRIFGFFRGSE